MTWIPQCYPDSTGPYAWRCCDERYPFSYGIVTDRKDTVDAWREGNIKFQELHSFVGGVETLAKRAVDFIRLNDPFGDHFAARDLHVLSGEPTNLEERYENCPCGGNDCSAVPGGPLLGCPYVKDSTGDPVQLADDWQDDPASDERWNAGCTFALDQLCKFMGVDPAGVTWDAATETVDGDVHAVIGNILRAKYGEDWGPGDLAQTEKVPAISPDGIVEKLRTRAKAAREEGTGTAEGDAYHFEGAANEIERLQRDLKPFAAVAESDIGQDETDADIFQPMRSGYNREPLITVGDMRRASQVTSTQRQCPNCGTPIPGHSSFAYCGTCREMGAPLSSTDRGSK